MEASDLARLVDRHFKLVGDVSRLHVQSNGRQLRMTSGNQAGVVFSNTTEAASGNIRACVNGEAFRGMLRAANKIQLSLRDSRLFIEGPGIRADLPTLSAGDVPQMSKAGDGVQLGEDDVDWLRTVIERVKLKDPSADAQLSIACDGRDLVVCYYDSFHGAFTSKEGTAKMAFGFFPSDVDLLQNALSVKSPGLLHAAGNNLIVRTKGETTMLPSTVSQAVSPLKVAEGAKPVAEFDSDDLRTALDGMSSLAKDGNPVRVRAAKDGLEVSIESKAGGLARKVKSRARRPLDAKVSFKYLYDTLRQCRGPADLLAHVDDSDTPVRLQVDCDGYTYLTVTTD